MHVYMIGYIISYAYIFFKFSVFQYIVEFEQIMFNGISCEREVLFCMYMYANVHATYGFTFKVLMP